MSVDADPRSARSLLSVVVLVAGGICAVIVVRNVFAAASGVLGWAAASTVVALLLTPVVDIVDRLFPRAVAIVTVIVLFGAVGVAVSSFVGIEFRGQVQLLQERGPEIAASIEQRDDRLGDAAREISLADRVIELTERLDESVGSTGDAVRSAALAAPAFLVSGILTIFLLIFGPRMAGAGIDQLPARLRSHARRVMAGSTRDTQRYCWATLLQCSVIGFAAWFAARLVEAPAPALLGLIAAVAAAVPYMGVVIGSIPLIVIAVGVAPIWQVGTLAVAVLAIQAGEALLWRPFVDDRALYVGPAVTIVFGVLGFALYGVGGALVTLVVGVFVLAIGDQLSTSDEVPTPVDDFEPDAASVGNTTGAGQARRNPSSSL